jgi:hypothetical protein
VDFVLKIQMYKKESEYFFRKSLEIRNVCVSLHHNYADMVKLVDMPDLGSGAARRVGSSPIIRTEALLFRRAFFMFILFVKEF